MGWWIIINDYPQCVLKKASITTSAIYPEEFRELVGRKLPNKRALAQDYLNSPMIGVEFTTIYPRPKEAV